MIAAVFTAFVACESTPKEEAPAEDAAVEAVEEVAAEVEEATEGE